MVNLLNKIDYIEDLVFQNKCWLELMLGYCLNKSENIDEICNLLPIVEVIIKENQKTMDILEEISDECYKNFYLTDIK